VGRFSPLAILDVAVGRFGHIENLWAVMGRDYHRPSQNPLVERFILKPVWIYYIDQELADAAALDYATL